MLAIDASIGRVKRHRMAAPLASHRTATNRLLPLPGAAGLLFYPLEMILGALVFSILISGLSASIGVLVSLRAGSVRQAQQMMSAGMLVLFLPFMLAQFIPAGWLETAGELLADVQPVSAAIGVALVLLLIESVLIAIAMRFFRRSKLILD